MRNYNNQEKNLEGKNQPDFTRAVTPATILQKKGIEECTGTSEEEEEEHCFS